MQQVPPPPQSPCPGSDPGKFAAELLAHSAGAIATRVLQAFGSSTAEPRLPPPIDNRSVLRELILSKLGYLAAAVRYGIPGFLIDNVRSTHIAWAARGTTDAALQRLLDALETAVVDALPAQAARVCADCLRTSRAAFGTAVAPPATSLDGSSKAGRLALRFLVAILEGRSRDATAMLIEEVERGRDVASLYLEVLVPAQVEVGRLWLTGSLNVAEEHITTSAVLEVLGRLRGRLTDPPEGAHVVLCTTLEDNDHDIGMRMLADLLLARGWRSYCPGGGLPPGELLQALLDFKVEVLALSVSLPPQLVAVERFIALLRANAETARIPVLVGGRAFRGAPLLWRTLGADGHAEGLSEALQVIEQLGGRG